MAATIKDIKKLAKRDAQDTRGRQFDGQSQAFTGPDVQLSRSLRQAPFEKEAEALANRLKR